MDLKTIYKTYLQPVLLVIGAAILFAKILNWSFDFPESTVDMLNVGIHILLGLIFAGNSLLVTNFWVKAAFLVCGLFLLIIDVLPATPATDYLTIFAILVPIVLNRVLEKPGYADTQSSDQ